LFDEEYGGSAMGMVEMAVVLEEMGRALLPGPYLSTVLLAGAVIDKSLNTALKSKWLTPICSGEAKSTLALLESHASWSPEAVAMSARQDSSGYVLQGTKLFVPDAGVSDMLVCAARIGRELALFAVPARMPEIGIERMPS